MATARSSRSETHRGPARVQTQRDHHGEAVTAGTISDALGPIAAGGTAGGDPHELLGAVARTIVTADGAEIRCRRGGWSRRRRTTRVALAPSPHDVERAQRRGVISPGMSVRPR